MVRANQAAIKNVKAVFDGIEEARRNAFTEMSAENLSYSYGVVTGQPHEPDDIDDADVREQLVDEIMTYTSPAETALKWAMGQYGHGLVEMPKYDIQTIFQTMINSDMLKRIDIDESVTLVISAVLSSYTVMMESLSETFEYEEVVEMLFFNGSKYKNILKLVSDFEALESSNPTSLLGDHVVSDAEQLRQITAMKDVIHKSSPPSSLSDGSDVPDVNKYTLVLVVISILLFSSVMHSSAIEEEDGVISLTVGHIDTGLMTDDTLNTLTNME